MSVLKYRDPTTGEFKVSRTVKVVGGDTVPTIPPEQLPPTEFPDYVRTEAVRVAANVRSVMKDDSIISVKISDTHYVGETASAPNDKQTDEGNIHACMAIKALAYLLPIDYIAHMGDVGKGTIMENNEVHKKEISDYLKYFREAVGKIPFFVAIGNHDTAIYYHNGQTDGGVHTLPADWLYDTFTAPLENADTVISGESCGGYLYRDFPEKKLRVFLLNTSENLIVSQTDNGTSETQRLWTAKALQNLNAKTDAAAWGFVVLAHYALDYGDACRISNVFKAYVNGESYTANGETVNFSGSNAARFYAQFHGHFHCFKSDSLHGFETYGQMQPYNVWRLCTPNANYNAENNYSGRLFYGIDFGESASYPKTPDSAKDTSFVVDVLTPSENTIHSFCYGTGYDRTVSMDGKAYYSVSKNLTLASVTDESGTTVAENESYSCKIVADDECTIQSVAITMGGVDITSSAYDESTGAVNIASVTGLVVITVVAKAPPVNLITRATTADGVTIFGDDYNGDGKADGYQKGMFIGSDGEHTETAFANAYCTGWIACAVLDNAIILRNIGTADVNWSKVRIIGYSRIDIHADVSTLYLKDITPESDGSIRITPDMWNTTTKITHIRVSGSYMGDDSSVMVE